ncbi:DUF6943 family protein [Wenyingzhuangia sp. IMCC45574]
MFCFEIKTHRKGNEYQKPYFFILNKGLNSGKSLVEPCPNCYVVLTDLESDRNTLFHLSLMLQIGGFYKPNLKGSVILFITIKDCSNTLKNGLNNTTNSSFQSILQVVSEIHQNELKYKDLLKKMEALKVGFIRSCFLKP